MPHRRLRLLLTAWLAWLALASAAAGATRYDPRLRFQSLVTPHFVIHYHQGQEANALRLSRIAEDVHAELSARLGHVPRARTHVVLVDQADDPNGWATPLPYNLMEIVAAPPSGASILGNTQDWLRLVFTHEYTHILHLDQGRGWARAMRAVFGRTPLAFPNLTLPLWHIEGLATYEESRHGEGRLNAGDFHAVVREPARAGRVEPLDRVNGGLVHWPSGTGWYAYGAYFHEYLARRFGDAQVLALSRRTAGRVPYLSSGVFKSVFGQSLGSLWRDFAAETVSRASEPLVTAATPVRLTHHGFVVDGPRVEPGGSIVYSRRDAHDFPSILQRQPDGTTTRVATRYGGSQLTGDSRAIYFDQLELQRNVALASDVYRWDRETHEVRRLTHGARLTELDLSPDGRLLAAIRVHGGARTLVVLDRARLDRGDAGPDLLVVGDAQAVFANPRWSPDGGRIAAERRRRGGPSEIVVVDATTGNASVVVSASTGRTVTPTWTPGGDALVYAADAGGGPFELYRVQLHAGRVRAAGTERLTRISGGAHAPAISPDGETIVYVGYTPEGYDLFTVPLRAGEAVVSQVVPSETAPRPAADPDAAPTAPSRTYRPWSTLWPRTWVPLIEWDDDQVRLGAAVAAVDALGYHGWSAGLTWPVSQDSRFGSVAPRDRPDVVVGYAYDRWRPTLYAQYADETTPLLLRQTETPEASLLPVAVRERSLDVGAAIPFRRVRWSQQVLAAWRTDATDVVSEDGAGALDRRSVRVGWSLNTSRRYGYSVSPEHGLQAGVAAETTREALGASGDATMTRADVRGFLPALPRHAVIALRASGATTTGDPEARRLLLLGGAERDGAALSFDEDATSLLRGFPSNAFAGQNVALLNAEYRLPLVYLERGLGTWPLFLRSVHATGFVDVGHAWTGAFRTDAVKQSWGAELSLDVTAAYALPMTWTVGVAWGRDGAGAYPDAREVYVRLGHGF